MSLLLPRLLSRRHLSTLHRVPRLRVSIIGYPTVLRPRIFPSVVQGKNRMSTKMTPAADYETLDPSLLVEEETLRGYKAKHYYPVRIGDLFHDRYSVIGKLGYGSASTVWLCRDLQQEKEYVALKVYINCSKVHRELPIYKHINSLDSEHDGRNYIRKMLDSFEISGPDGKHTYLVHEALGMNPEELRELLDELLAPDLIRQSLRGILRGLDFLREARVIHTG